MSGSPRITDAIDAYITEINTTIDGNRPDIDTDKLIEKINNIRIIKEFAAIDDADCLSVFYASCAALKFECEQYTEASRDYLRAALHCGEKADLSSDKESYLQYGARALVEKHLLDLTKLNIVTDERLAYQPHIKAIQKLMDEHKLFTPEDVQYHGRFQYYCAIFEASQNKLEKAETHLKEAIDYFSRDLPTSRIQLCYSQHAMAALCKKALQYEKANTLERAIESELTAPEKASDAYKSAIVLWETLTADKLVTAEVPIKK